MGYWDSNTNPNAYLCVAASLAVIVWMRYLFISVSDQIVHDQTLYPKVFYLFDYVLYVTIAGLNIQVLDLKWEMLMIDVMLLAPHLCYVLEAPAMGYT